MLTGDDNPVSRQPQGEALNVPGSLAARLRRRVFRHVRTKYSPSPAARVCSAVRLIGAAACNLLDTRLERVVRQHPRLGIGHRPSSCAAASVRGRESSLRPPGSRQLHAPSSAAPWMRAISTLRDGGLTILIVGAGLDHLHHIPPPRRARSGTAPAAAWPFSLRQAMTSGPADVGQYLVEQAQVVAFAGEHAYALATERNQLTLCPACSSHSMMLTANAASSSRKCDFHCRIR